MRPGALPAGKVPDDCFPIVMAGRLRQVVLFLTIICVLVVLVAPSVDLPDTALRASQYAALVMFCMTLAIVSLLLAMALFCGSQAKERPSGRISLALHPLLCTFLF
ncbi:MAG TPA: hypothetical protein VJW20_02910 [Candidatus Angelobacter sp.]|nr:hypothetical protein [Candidatus Angelobacter sp.]